VAEWLCNDLQNRFDESLHQFESGPKLQLKKYVMLHSLKKNKGNRVSRIDRQKIADIQYHVHTLFHHSKQMPGEIHPLVNDMCINFLNRMVTKNNIDSWSLDWGYSAIATLTLYYNRKVYVCNL
jgi:hypothetical protein